MSDISHQEREPVIIVDEHSPHHQPGPFDGPPCDLSMPFPALPDLPPADEDSEACRTVAVASYSYFVGDVLGVISARDDLLRDFRSGVTDLCDDGTLAALSCLSDQSLLTEGERAAVLVRLGVGPQALGDSPIPGALARLIQQNQVFLANTACGCDDEQGAAALRVSVSLFRQLCTGIVSAWLKMRVKRIYWELHEALALLGLPELDDRWSGCGTGALYVADGIGRAHGRPGIEIAVHRAYADACYRMLVLIADTEPADSIDASTFGRYAAVCRFTSGVDGATGDLAARPVGGSRRPSAALG